MALRTGRVGINVTDLDRSRRFSPEVVGLEALGESTEDGRGLAFLGVATERAVAGAAPSCGYFD